ncbi:YjzD family protein [Bacillus sp. B1-b2]|uniref:YjzD family protein n=1 Tax=Bacillus sp. B1-b2 TaxID=2653201 RepID=UPI00186A2F58|nr:YjzD family protein [Bacillus sp. B1-b2]
MTIFWTFVLSQMLVYVVGSMNGVPFSFTMGLILTVVFSLLVFLISAIIPDEPTRQEGSH